MKYIQCELIREKGIGIISKITTYLPEKFAKKDKIIKLIALNGTWRVNKIFSALDEKYCNERSQDYKKQRKASDV
jgi:hypothetical protein